jgi:hypothetical protein
MKSQFWREILRGETKAWVWFRKLHKRGSEEVWMWRCELGSSGWWGDSVVGFCDECNEHLWSINPGSIVPSWITDKFHQEDSVLSSWLIKLTAILTNVFGKEWKLISLSAFQFGSSYLMFAVGTLFAVHKAHREELECVLQILEKVLVYLPELLSRRWQCHSLTRIMTKLLHPGNSWKLRREAIRYSYL